MPKSPPAQSINRINLGDSDNSKSPSEKIEEPEQRSFAEDLEEQESIKRDIESLNSLKMVENETFGDKVEQKTPVRNGEYDFQASQPTFMFESITDTDEDRLYKQTIRNSMLMSA